MVTACLQLRYFGGLSAQEIAASPGCSPSAVKSRLSKIRESSVIRK
ncbi:MAG: hypothetical protein HY717_21295 [Planctomycetes bacterium]|nr:hypothetical protein [Planctomycetota bacterium]